jgi:excisionase family DNA binding protein
VDQRLLLELSRGELQAMIDKAVNDRIVAASPADILTLEQVAQYMQVTTVTIRSWIKTNEFPGAKCGVEWRFRRGDVDNWREERMLHRNARPTKLAAVKRR